MSNDALLQSIDSSDQTSRACNRVMNKHLRTKKANPFASAMAMLNFYINRAGIHLPVSQREILENAKTELRKLYDRFPNLQ